MNNKSFLDQYMKRKPDPPLESQKPKKQYFTSGECQGCYYKATYYCWHNCSINVWKKQSDW